uniref:SMAP domain-containing protein n=1 Tax=Steinernema glaseri TaxID=37863 RepID=A0A1I7ZNF5_9BILA
MYSWGMNRKLRPESCRGSPGKTWPRSSRFGSRKHRRHHQLSNSTLEAAIFLTGQRGLSLCWRIRRQKMALSATDAGIDRSNEEAVEWASCEEGKGGKKGFQPAGFEPAT